MSTRLAQLQGAVGNQAVSALLAEAGSARLRVVQRHSSWEHALLGDTAPSKLGQAVVSVEARGHLLSREWARMVFFRRNPLADPRAEFPDVRWIQLRGSSLWLSNGELNALADYLPDPAAYDTMAASQLIPVVQRMRSGIRAEAGKMFGLRATSMAGQAEGSWLPGAAGEVRDLDRATRSLGTSRYAGLLARNACHFAPFSWQRWALYHGDALDEARLQFDSRKGLRPLGSIDRNAEEHERQAILKNGYADHFLQDSFAAGHLVNKTLVMQWFVDYLNGLNWIERPWVGMPDDDVMARMGSSRQPGVAGLDRYGMAPDDMPGSLDRELGSRAIDPQTAQERPDRYARVLGSGVSGVGEVRERNYQAYLRFLNSAFLQLAAGAVHDYFNARGLMVITGRGDEMQVGGDDTVLSRSGALGAEIAAEAALASRRAVDDVLLTGSTGRSIENTFAMVPQQVRVHSPLGGHTDHPLANFQNEVIRPLCWEEIFPELVDSWKGLAVRAAGEQMVSGGVSGDVGTAPVPSGPLGDFPVPTAGPRG